MNHRSVTTLAAAVVAITCVTVPGAPAMAATPADNRAYVAVFDDAAGFVVHDTDDNTQVASATNAADAFFQHVAMSHDGTEVYASNALPSATLGLAVFDTATNVIVDSIAPPSGTFANSVAASPTNDIAYLGYQGQTEGGIAVVDTATRTIVDTIVLGAGVRIRDLTLSPDGARLYAADDAGNRLFVVDTAAAAVTATVTGFGQPQGVAVSPDGDEVYVADLSVGATHGVRIVDATTATIDDTIAVDRTYELAVSPDGSRVYSTSGDEIDVIDSPTRTVVDSVAVPSSTDLLGVAVTADGASVYAIDFDQSLLAEIDASTLTTVDTVTTDGLPSAIALGPVGPQPEADLAVTLDASGGLLGSSINYDVTLDNNGPADATAATVEVSLPPATSTVTGLPAGCSYASSTDTVTCTVGAIANGSDTTRSFRANLGLLSLGPLPATATRTASTPTDPNAANDSDSADCTAVTSLLITC